MKTIHTLAFDCDTCYGKGWLFYGGAEDYNVEPCDCNPNSIFDGSLFLKENDYTKRNRKSRRMPSR